MQTINVVDVTESKLGPYENAVEEARRQFEICNACRYCESYCSVFPALHQQSELPDGDIKQLANLCHNCRSCHYACQFTAPHEFSINVPKVLAEVRQEVWQENTFPKPLSRLFHRSGSAIAIFSILFFSLFLWSVQTPMSRADNFYSLISHNTLVALFTPAFILPLIVMAIGLRRYWLEIGGKPIKLQHLVGAIQSAVTMKNLASGHGEGCNFEDEDRFSNARRYLHQATMYGFLLCFAATSTGTLMHYLFDLKAPYALFSLPKLFGLSGGILLCIGTLGLAWLKLKADSNLADRRVWGGEMAFILLLFAVSASGLLLYMFAQTPWLAGYLALHLGSVISFFLLMPYSKMVHGFYRLAALIRDQQ